MIELKAIGNLGADSEYREINGKNYLSFSVAATENKRTTWVKCLKYDKDSKLGQYLKKGDKVYVSGYPAVDSYNDKAGLSLFVNSLEMLGGLRPANPERTQPPANASMPAPVNSSQSANNTAANAPDNGTIDDLPF